MKVVTKVTAGHSGGKKSSLTFFLSFFFLPFWLEGSLNSLCDPATQI